MQTLLDMTPEDRHAWFDEWITIPLPSNVKGVVYLNKPGDFPCNSFEAFHAYGVQRKPNDAHGGKIGEAKCRFKSEEDRQTKAQAFIQAWKDGNPTKARGDGKAKVSQLTKTMREMVERDLVKMRAKFDAIVKTDDDSKATLQAAFLDNIIGNLDETTLAEYTDIATAHDEAIAKLNAKQVAVKISTTDL